MCTVIKMKTENGFLLGKNNDTFFEEGILFTNKRGVKKRALIMPPAVPFQWVSKYGSLSFSQCGKELPVGGMNEAGLIVEQTTLPETKYPEYQGIAGIGELQIIQCILDTCANVHDAIRLFEQVEICQPTWTIHYVLADKSGDMAIIEYVNGERKIYCGDDLTVEALTNSRYDKSINLSNKSNQNLCWVNDYEKNSFFRFIKASGFLNSKNSFDVQSAFKALENLERTDTVWNIIYHPQTLNLYFKTKSSKGIKSIDINKIDLGEKSQPLLFPLSDSADGNINDKMIKYSREKNGELVNKFFRNTILASVMNLSVPDELLDYLTSYPEILEGIY